MFSTKASTANGPHSARALLILFLAALSSLILMQWLLPDEPLVDEHFHLGQIRLINGPEFQRVPELTTPLGYHYSVALPARLAGLDSLNALRAISAVLGLLGLFLAWACLRRDDPEHALLGALQLLACPLLWPFYFLLYTDLPSLTLVLGATLLLGRQRFWLAAMLGVAMLAWRQSNVFWAMLLWLIALHQAGLGLALGQARHFTRDALRTGLASVAIGLQKTWMLALPLVAFGVFVWLNQGVALGDRAAHQFGGALYPTQIFFLLLVLWLLLLPLLLARLPELIALIRRRPWILLALLALLGVYLASFQVSHVYNLGLPEFHLRNRVLAWLSESLWLRVLAFLPMAWALLGLCLIRLRAGYAYWLYPVTVLALLPVQLIEQRYYIVPVVIFLLFRQAERRALEWVLLAWFALLSLTLSLAIASTRYFL